MTWQCRFIDSSGIKCTSPALIRLHFAKDHPFDFTDVCRTHLYEYTNFVAVQDINGTQPDIIYNIEDEVWKLKLDQ